MPFTCMIGLVGYALLFRQVLYKDVLIMKRILYDQMLTESRVIHGRLSAHVMALSIYDCLLILSSFFAFSKSTLMREMQ